MSAPLLLVAGIPVDPYQHVKKPGILVNGWETALLPSRQRRFAEFDRDLCNRLLKVATGHSAGAHILGFSQQRERAEWAHALQGHFRFRWINSDYLAFLPNRLDEFVAAVQAEADFERAWRQQLLPQNRNSPLLLPECAFSPRCCDNLWELASSVAPPGDQRDPTAEIGRVVSVLERFRQFHWDNGGWMDEKNLQFSIGAMHAEPPEERWYWKYSWRVPDRFHYDVTHVRGREFSVRDLEFKTHRVRAGAHINVDCHGRCRG